MRRSHILIRNSLSNFIASLWMVILSFCTTPYIVHKLGADAYGILALVIAVIGYFQFLELGLGKAVIKYVSEYYAKKDFEMIKKITGSALVVYCIMGLIGALVISLLTGLIVTRLLKIPPNLIDVARIVFYISALGFFINMPRNVFGSIPKALQRFDLTNSVDVVIGTVQILLTVLLLYLGYFLREIVILNVGINLLSILVYIVISKRLLRGVDLGLSFNMETFKKLFKFGGFVTINNILITFAARINSFFIGIFMPVSYVTYYAVPESIASRTAFIPNSISQAIFPSFSELDSEARKDLLRELFLRSTKYIIILTMPFIILFVAFAYKFLYYWMGGEFAAKSTLVLQLLGVAYLITFWGYSSVVGAQGLNRPDMPAKLQVLFAAANVLLCIILIPKFGIVGAALAWAISRFILMPVFIYSISSRLFNADVRQLWDNSLKKPLILGLILLLISCFITPLLFSLFFLIFVFVLLSAIYLALSYFFIFDTYDRQFARQYIRRNR